MAEIHVNIGDLELDLQNPRSPPSTTQRDARQKILDAGEDKLVDLADSILDYGGLNPMDRMLVIKTEANPPRYTVIEGNRRTAALQLLTQPELLTDLSLAPNLKKRLVELAKTFNRRTVEPLAVWELPDRSAANQWLRLRHTGENGGRGIIDWSSLQQRRFTGGSPELQAIDFVKAHGQLSPDEAKALEGRYVTTVKRLLEVPKVRKLIGLEIESGRLTTKLPGPEVLKPLRRIVLDLAEKRINVRELMTVDQMEGYINKFPKADLPSGTPASDAESRPIDGIKGSEFKGSPLRRRRPKNPNDRPRLVPRSHNLHVREDRPGAIFEELRTLKFEDAPNAIAVLFRVFFELSVDSYMRHHKMHLSVTHNGHEKHKTLDKKTEEVVDDIVKKSGEPKVFKNVLNATTEKRNPLNFDLLHSYVHNQWGTPSQPSLIAAWDNAQPLLEKIWHA